MLIALATGLTLISVLGVSYVPTLAARFRRRLRSLLEDRAEPQVALARSISLSKSQLSRILKYDAHAGGVTVRSLEVMAGFFHIPAADLLRTGEEDVLSLTSQERTLIEYFRLLPNEQQLQMVGFLEYMFKPRREAKAQLHAVNILRQNVERQLADLAKAK